MKRGSIALARELCVQIAGYTDDDQDQCGHDYGSVDIAEILSAEVVRLQKALAQPVQEPVAWDKPSASFNQWWNGDYDGSANPYDPDSKAHWAWAGWKAAQTVQEPVAWLYPEGLESLQNGKCWTAYPTEHEDCNIPLYTASPQRPWVRLTEQERNDIEDALGLFIGKPAFDAIEASLKERNT
jgi:hypothetical protein